MDTLTQNNKEIESKLQHLNCILDKCKDFEQQIKKHDENKIKFQEYEKKQIKIKYDKDQITKTISESNHLLNCIKYNKSKDADSWKLFFIDDDIWDDKDVDEKVDMTQINNIIKNKEYWKLDEYKKFDFCTIDTSIFSEYHNESRILHIINNLINNHEKNNGQCLIHYLCQNYYVNDITVQLLEQSPNLINLTTNKNENIHHLMCKHNSHSIKQIIKSNNAKIYLTNDALTQQDSLGNTPLHYLCMNNDVFTYTMQYYLDWCPEIIDMINKKRETPLHLAVQYQNIKKVKMLINDYGACQTKQDDCGRTAKSYAIRPDVDNLLTIDRRELIELFD